jgi:hypothetical protein
VCSFSHKIIMVLAFSELKEKAYETNIMNARASVTA